MKIYPKTNEYLEGIENLEEQLKKEKGLEIQYFNKDENELVDFEIEKPIKEILEKYPFIEEITIHPPLTNYELEIILLKDKNIFLKQIKNIVKLSKKYNIKINIIEHTRLLFSQAKRTIIPLLKQVAKIMKNTKTKILFENIYMMEEKEKCKRQVYQIHFAYTANNDGYIDRATHAIHHPTEQQLYYDAELLCRCGMEKCNWVTEVAEINYKTREKQIQEIKGLENYKKIKEYK